ncbi:mycofactocin-coupled SDR family oxidoreductase [Sporichthya brevicatena]|uniref:Mycofactocin-coupled SDR family oxidoreductase n=1 Tax=Sporichthya brevicatena TaxID=171442 RepID=A0ABP3RD97_9ACTN
MGVLDGQVAIVTGGARGQGRSHAIALAREGAAVVVADIAADMPTIDYPLATPAELEETVRLVEKEDRRALGLQADLRNTAAVQGVVDATLAEFGRIDILVANHGVINYGTVENTTDEMWETVLATNITGYFKMMRAVIPTMRAQNYGRIVCTASFGARGGFPNLPAYTAAKWGVIGLAKGTALEVQNSGITINVVAPAAVGTGLFLNQPTYNLFCPDIENPTRDDFEARLVQNNAGLNGRRYLDPEHVTRAVMFHVTDVDGVMTGQVTDVGLGASALRW